MATLTLGAGPALAAAPTNTTPPAITAPASPHVGDVLTFTPGVWSDPTAALTDQWMDCSGTSCTAIPGTTPNQASYMLASTDIGQTIEIQESAVGAVLPVNSSPTATVAADPPPAPVNSSAPTITGVTWSGQTLTEHNGTWSNSPTSYTYRWLRCPPSSGACVATGQTGSTYALSDADIGHAIEVEETAFNGVTPGMAKPSGPTAVITAPLAANPGPTIFGSLQVGHTLTEGHAIWNVSPAGYTYQWERCSGAPPGCSAIAGATRQTYTTTGADLGSQIAVVETASSGGGHASAASGLTPAISGTPAPVTSTTATSLVVSPATAVAGQVVTLIATITSGSSTTAPAGTLSVENRGVPISGCAHLPVAGSGQTVTVICQTEFGAATLAMQAVFSPGARAPVSGSVSPTVAMVIGRAPSFTDLTAAAQASVGTVVYTATVGPLAAGGATVGPSGRVVFTDGGAPIAGCTSQTLVAGSATCTVRYRRTGRHLIAAQYQGDSDFVSSTSAPAPVNVGPGGPAGFVTSTMGWTFAFTPSYSRIIQLVATGLANGTSIVLTCHGSGCPFQRHSVSSRRPRRCPRASKHRCAAPHTIHLTPLFNHAHLGVGTQLIIVIEHQNWLGKYYRFLIRRGRPPRITTSCLRPGASRPGVGC